MVVLERVSLISKISLGSRRVFSTKLLPGSLRLGIIGCLTLSINRKGILINQTRRLLVSSFEKIISVNA